MGTPTASLADHNAIGWRFDNTYARLPGVLFTPARPAAFREPATPGDRRFPRLDRSVPVLS